MAVAITYCVSVLFLQTVSLRYLNCSIYLFSSKMSTPTATTTPTAVPIITSEPVGIRYNGFYLNTVPGNLKVLCLVRIFSHYFSTLLPPPLYYPQKVEINSILIVYYFNRFSIYSDLFAFK